MDDKITEQQIEGNYNGSKNNNNKTNTGIS